MKFAVLALLSSTLLFGQAAPEPLTPWVTGSAATTLGCIVGWLLTRTIPSMQRDFRKALDAMAERHERWEKTRHDDSTKLNETLRSMAVVCAKVHDLATPDSP